jgi:hypothetical protein
MADNSKDTRLARELESRDTQERPKQWKRPEVLPEPNQEPGYTYRWVRVAMLGQQDPRNVSSKTREGWEPVPASEQSHLQMLVDPNSRFKDILRSRVCCSAKCLMRWLNNVESTLRNKTNLKWTL